jgi:hypothetical protein
MATLTVSNSLLTFTSGVNGITSNPAYIKNNSYNLGVAYYTTNSSGDVTGNTTIGTNVYAKKSDMSYNTSYDFTITTGTNTVTFTMTSENPGVSDITDITINGSSITISDNNTVSSCTLSYVTNTANTISGYVSQYYSSTGSSIATDTVIYTDTNNVATYTYCQSVSDDTLIYFDTLMLGINAIYDALASSTTVQDEYAGFIDLAMAEFDNLSSN